MAQTRLCYRDVHALRSFAWNRNASLASLLQVTFIGYAYVLGYVSLAWVVFPCVVGPLEHWQDAWRIRKLRQGPHAFLVGKIHLVESDALDWRSLATLLCMTTHTYVSALLVRWQYGPSQRRPLGVHWLFAIVLLYFFLLQLCFSPAHSTFSCPRLLLLRLFPALSRLSPLLLIALVLGPYSQQHPFLVFILLYKLLLRSYRIVCWNLCHPRPRWTPSWTRRLALLSRHHAAAVSLVTKRGQSLDRLIQSTKPRLAAADAALYASLLRRCCQFWVQLLERPWPDLTTLDSFFASHTLCDRPASPAAYAPAVRTMLRDDLSLRILQEPRHPRYRCLESELGHGTGQRVLPADTYFRRLCDLAEAVLDRLFLPLATLFPSIFLAFPPLKQSWSEPLAVDPLSSPAHFASVYLAIPRPGPADDLAPPRVDDLAFDASFRSFSCRLLPLMRCAVRLRVQARALERHFGAMCDFVEAEKAAARLESELHEAVLDEVMDWNARRDDAATKRG